MCNIAINIFYLINFISYYAGIMLNAFSDKLCSKLCYYNKRVPILGNTDLIKTHYEYNYEVSTITLFTLLTF